MKRLVVTLAVLCLVGTASAQGVAPTVPDTPRFRAPIGIKDIPKHYSKDALGQAPSATELPETYEKALEAYKDAIQQRPASAPSQEGVDCAMIIWADTTATVPIPTLKPAPNVDPNMPMLGQGSGCTPPASVKQLPDSLHAPQFPLKKYPMKFPGK